MASILQQRFLHATETIVGATTLNSAGSGVVFSTNNEVRIVKAVIIIQDNTTATNVRTAELEAMITIAGGTPTLAYTAVLVAAMGAANPAGVISLVVSGTAIIARFANDAGANVTMTVFWTIYG